MSIQALRQELAHTSNTLGVVILSLSEAQSALDEYTEMKAQLEAHRRFHDKAGCPGADDCYVCELEKRERELLELGDPLSGDDYQAMQDIRAEKWKLFPRLAQAATEARLHASRLEAALKEIIKRTQDCTPLVATDVRHMAQLALCGAKEGE